MKALAPLCLVATLAVGGPALAAEDEGVNALDQFLTDASQCVPLSAIRKTGAQVVTLMPEQFQFVRALYVIIPPVSHELPPGEIAIQATLGDRVMMAIVVGGGPQPPNAYGYSSLVATPSGAQSCARFRAPPFIVKMIEDVATHTTMPLGEPL